LLLSPFLSFPPTNIIAIAIPQVVAVAIAITIALIVIT
jgi:hypothetical protein